MLPAPYVVGLVVDPDFSERLPSLADRIHVWVADTPQNRMAAELIRKAEPTFDFARGVTLFSINADQGRDVWAADIIGTIETHHGSYTHDPPVSCLEVFGVPAGEPLKRVLARYGFTHVVERGNAFQAWSRPAV